jgi:histidinol dehydrogenase
VVRVQRLARADYEALGSAGVAAQLRGLVPDGASVAGAVAEIVAQVRERGDEALIDYTRRFDTGGAEPLALRVAPEALDAAIQMLPLDVVAGLQVAIGNVAEVAQLGVADDGQVILPQGQRIVVRELPVASAAVYVPGGRAPYPSTVVMGVVTARAAGVFDVAVCAPPGPSGDIHPAILGTCRLCGVDTVYRMGGAQAVAALAHGTETVQRVDVIVGPGNLYVQEAKRQVSRLVGIDGFAGPSDLLAVLGPDADVHLVALDLLAQAEHGADSLVGALAASDELLDALEAELREIGGRHPQLPDAPCALVCTPDLREAIAVANAFAPEHLQLVGREAEALAPLVASAGCLFVGAPSATAFGDYVAGSNHVLPTGGAARFASSLSPRHFRRRMAEVHVGAGAAKLAAAGAPIARAEGFVLHAESMEARAARAPDGALRENGLT